LNFALVAESVLDGDGTLLNLKVPEARSF